MRLADFLKQNSDRVMAQWETEARRTAPARDMTGPALIDQLPRLLEDFSLALAAKDRPSRTDTVDDHADEHAAERLDQGFRLSQVVQELGQLRSCILQLWRESHPSLTIDDAQQLTMLVDRAVERAVDRYVERRVRLTAAFEKIASAALEVDDLAPFLNRLLTVFMEVAPSMDSAAILLREGDHLRVRATIGLEEEARAGFAVEIGEGFSGSIGASKQPKELKNAWSDPLVRSPSLHLRRTLALYGVPLLDGAGELIGVAHVGTRLANEISKAEKRIFAAVANRAASAIVRHELRMQARRRLAELSAVIEAIPGAVFLGDGDHGLTMANSVGLRSLGLSSNAELHGIDLPSIVQRVDARDATTQEPITVQNLPLWRALRGEGGVFDIVATDLQNGTRHYLRSHAGTVLVEGKNVGAVVVASDISELHRAMEELKRTAEFRERFVAIVSHDLRNPLQAIGASASLLIKSPAFAPELAKPVGRIVSNVERMAGMISELLDFARGRLGGGIPLETSTVDLARLASRIIEGFEDVHPTRQIVCEARGNTTGQWDAERLAQVLTNLLGNATDHGAPDEPIRVAVDGNGSSVVLSVSNAGPPIPQELLPYIFDPFRRAKAERRPAEGLGLGLYIVSEIVRAHNGHIEVSSKAQATTFTITLPRRVFDE